MSICASINQCFSWISAQFWHNIPLFRSIRQTKAAMQRIAHDSGESGQTSLELCGDQSYDELFPIGRQEQRMDFLRSTSKKFSWKMHSQGPRAAMIKNFQHVHENQPICFAGFPQNQRLRQKRRFEPTWIFAVLKKRKGYPFLYSFFNSVYIASLTFLPSAFDVCAWNMRSLSLASFWDKQLPPAFTKVDPENLSNLHRLNFSEVSVKHKLCNSESAWCERAPWVSWAVKHPNCLCRQIVFCQVRLAFILPKRSSGGCAQNFVPRWSKLRHEEQSHLQNADKILVLMEVKLTKM